MGDYIPTREAELLTWASDLSAKLNLAPADYGLSVDDAAALAALVTAYDAAYNTAADPATRTKAKVVAKDLAKAQLKAGLRSISQQIQTNPSVTAEQKTDLGLPIRDREPTPVPPPATMPLVNIVDMAPRRQTLRLVDETTPASRAKPFGTVGAEIFTFVGPADTPAPSPSDLDQWDYQGIASRAEFEINYEGQDVGKRATIIARWINGKGERGPVSIPITGTIAA